MAEKQSWPAWRYGPNGEARIFNKDDVVPKGWVDSPKNVPQSEKLKEAPKGKAKKGAQEPPPELEPSAEEKAATIASIREAGIEIKDDATVEEINAAIDKLTAQQGS